MVAPVREPISAAEIIVPTAVETLTYHVVETPGGWQVRDPAGGAIAWATTSERALALALDLVEIARATDVERFAC